jgi:small GTP-binding protein
MDLLRFAAIGSVDDGKSTLIGRLLFDTRSSSTTSSKRSAWRRRRGIGEVDLSFVTDGLRAEREQGITIDVAYRYAATPTRKFIIADCPGHVQYTANMATGASTADLALVVVDVTSGLREQTRRHTCIAALLGVDQLLVVVNKMDLVGWDRGRLRRRGPTDGLALARRLSIASCTVVPISALHGDNVVAGPTPPPGTRARPCSRRWRRPRPADGRRCTAPTGAPEPAPGPVGAPPRRRTLLRRDRGRRAAAPRRRGGRAPGRPPHHRHRITTYDGELDEAPVGVSVSVDLADDLDVSRGDLIAAADEPPR